MEMHQSPIDMYEYKTKQEDETNPCSSNIDMLEQTDEVKNHHLKETKFFRTFSLFFFLENNKF